MNDAIFDAIEYDDIDELERLLDEADPGQLDDLVNLPDGEGYSPLIVSASIGLVEIAEVLLESKAKINYIAPDHASALFCAVQEKHWELVEVLVEFGADLNAQLDKGPTPLYIAAQEGYADMVGHLVEIKADPNLRAHGITPLFISCQENHPPVAKALIDRKADPNRRNKSGGLPVVVAAWRNNTDVVNELVKAPDIKLDKFGGANMSALMTAAKNKKTESVQILIAAKADLNKRCDSSLRGTAMHYAADKHYLDIMKMLKDGGCDSSIKNAAGHTAADMVMLNYDEFLDDYAHTSLNIAADRQLKTLEKEPAVKKEADPLPDPGTESEVEDEDHLVGWSAPQEESIATKRVESKQEKEHKAELKRQASSKDSSSSSSKKKDKKKKEKKKKSKRSKRRKKDKGRGDAGNSDGDAPAAAQEISPEQRIQHMLSKNERKLDTIREAFSDHDLDDSGYLDKPEFMACLGTLGVQEQFGRDFRAHVDKCFIEFDKDQNGRISFEEFVQFYNTIHNPTRARVHREKTKKKKKDPVLERPKAPPRKVKGSIDTSRGGGRDTNFLPTLRSP